MANDNKFMMDIKMGTPQSPLDFLMETGEAMYEMHLSNNGYIKYDALTDRILMVNTASGKLYGFAHFIDNGECPTGEKLAQEFVQRKMAKIADKFISYLGLRVERQILIPWSGKVIEPSVFSVTTIIGKAGDIAKLKNVLGDFRSTNLGELQGGINVLNTPNAEWTGVDEAEWMVKYILPWIRRAIARRDNFYLLTDPRDLIPLLYVNYEVMLPSVNAYVLNEIISARWKPINLKENEWDRIKWEIEKIKQSNKFENH